MCMNFSFSPKVRSIGVQEISSYFSPVFLLRPFLLLSLPKSSLSCMVLCIFLKKKIASDIPWSYQSNLLILLCLVFNVSVSWFLTSLNDV